MSSRSISVSSISSGENVLAKLRGRKVHLSPALMKVAEYVIHEPHKVIHQTLVDLADNSGSSEASVVRFCRDAGYSSFAAFKIDLSISLLKESPQTDDSEDDCVKNSLAKTVNSLNDTATLLDRELLDKTVELIGLADNIYFFGVGASATIATYGEYRMMRLGMRTRALDDMHSAVMTASCMRKEDSILLISGSGNTQDVIHTAYKAKNQGSTIIAITGNTRSELANIASLTLHTAVPESAFSAGAFYSKAAQMFVIDLIASGLLGKYPKLKDSVTQTAESIIFSQ